MAASRSADDSQQHRIPTAPVSSTSRLPEEQQRMAASHLLQDAPHLSDNQQNLLLAALNAQARDRQSRQSASARAADSGVNQHTTYAQPTQPDMSASTLFMSPADAELDNFNEDYTPDLDYLDGDESFDFDNADLGGEMIGALPGSGELHDKRKNPDEQDGSDEADPKRQEGEKGAKKPGRKPLTNEPTTKRKAQNRAAQRAFRERKERHLKDLETKVTQLARAREADKHEKELLQAQVARLNTELKESRKRLPLHGGSGSRGSPPLTAYGSQGRSNSGGPAMNNDNFHFEFPKFGALPSNQLFSTPSSMSNTNTGVLHRGSVTPPSRQSPTNIGIGAIPTQQSAQVQRHGSHGSQTGRRVSTKIATPVSNASSGTTPPLFDDAALSNVGFSTAQNMHGFASTLPQMNHTNPFADLFSPSLLKNANFDTNSNYFDGAPQHVSSHNSIDASTGGESTAGLNRVFQFNGGSNASDSASPSGSSSTQWNAAANSSCDTSPEPSHDSPAHTGHNNSMDSYVQDKSNTLLHTQYPQVLPTPQSTGNPNINLTGNNLDYWMPSTGLNDPLLFTEYRDQNEPSFGFFDDTLNTAPFDYGSPSNLFGILQSPEQMPASLNMTPHNTATKTDGLKPSSNLIAEMEKTRDGGDDDPLPPYNGATGRTTSTDQKDAKLISCNNIWSVPPHTSPPNPPLTTLHRNQLQSNPSFQAGTFDLDSLCSELKAKARCSESGVMVSQEHVDRAMKKLGKTDEAGLEDVPPLMFERESWERVMGRLGGTK
ncbi:hypothetical protein LTR62_006387 [Meristemomyces frigidus]|uniref:BZIP domain-containing protein n=1 Tax=Meristemomyces frigidus TaxID=1508187 RepID=A0AAN7YEM2_9PEZI|nr:hypothetical protein LTR62_006387 [Meristemomyces frigidus]